MSDWPGLYPVLHGQYVKYDFIIIIIIIIIFGINKEIESKILNIESLTQIEKVPYSY